MLAAEYYSAKGLNWSTLKHMRTSPLACLHAMQTTSADTTGRLVGRAVHALVLEGSTPWVEWTEGDRRGNKWKEFEAAHAGMAILKTNEADAVRAMAAAVRAHHAASALLSRVQGEVWLSWSLGDTPCKGLADGLGDGVLLDLKTCGPLAVFARKAWSDGHAHQLAWYRLGARAMGHRVDEVYLVGVEAKAPHDVGVWRLSDAVLDHAEREVLALAEDFVVCRESGEWPGAFPDVEEMGLPAWVEPADGMDEIDISIDDGGWDV